jgi:hypothetical protein
MTSLRETRRSRRLRPLTAAERRQRRRASHGRPVDASRSVLDMVPLRWDEVPPVEEVPGVPGVDPVPALDWPC